MIIMKFGGTSVRNREAIERVVSIVRGRLDRRPLVVVSALAKVTRQLCSIAESAQARRNDEAREQLDALRDRHLSLAAEMLGGDTAIFNDCVRSVNAICDSLNDFVDGVCRIGELSPRSYARIVSTGELLSSKIVAAAMNVSGLSCRWADAREMLVTDCSYMAAVPDMEMTEANIKRLYPEVSKGVSVVLTQGFIASSTEGFPSVLGFEGSDYSAAIFGMALNADRVEIWTDVDGIRTADPRIVPDTRRNSRVSYEEASEMAYLGARVLHPLTIEPARSRNIPVIVLNSAAPDGEGSEVTYEEVAPGPKSIALKDDIDFIQVMSRKIAGVSPMLSDVFGETGLAGVATGPSSASGSIVSLVVESGQPGELAAVEALRRRFDVKVFKDKALVSVVGRNAAVSRQVMDAVLGAAGNIYMLSVSPSLLSVSVVVDRDKAASVVSSLHFEIF
ncbi:MAG: aspartate kinase [Bacteroidales bacterium]|nr:aspartate kinase [Bacteroidales bacterium]